MEDAIRTHGLTRAFDGFVAVDHVDLRVPQGTVYGYLGLNGAGKSTTIRMLATLLRPTEGRALVAGHDVVEAPLEVRASIGLVADEAAEACGGWSPREYVGHFARLRGIRDRGAVERALDEVGIEPYWRRRALARHSTGMRRRVDIARALIGSPRVLFLDEPTRGLDLPAKRETWDLIARLARDEGVTVFLSSHDAGEIDALCERLAVIARGRVAFEGATRELGRDAATLEASLIRLLRGGTAIEDASKSSKPVAR